MNLRRRSRWNPRLQHLFFQSRMLVLRTLSGGFVYPTPARTDFGNCWSQQRRRLKGRRRSCMQRTGREWAQEEGTQAVQSCF